MAIQALPNNRFIRKTELGPEEYRKRFRQIDDEVIAAITSHEADRVTPLMSKIYLRLVNAPEQFWERQGVLRFEAQLSEGKRMKAWTALCEMLSVSSATANKALTWMHQEGIIGYFSGKNGVGLRIFLNRAVSSIGLKSVPTSKKILGFSPASFGEARASRNETGFKETHGVLDSLDQDLNSGAPKNGADNIRVNKTTSDQSPQCTEEKQAPTMTSRTNYAHTQEYGPGSLDEIVRRLRTDLEPALRSAAAQAAAHEHERTREWFENRGLPKAARVAQREAFNLLRRQGVIKESGPRAHAELMVGRDHSPHKAKLLTSEQIDEAAEICISMLECHGKAIDITLAEISAEAGGFLLAEDAPKVRELAESLARRSKKE